MSDVMVSVTLKRVTCCECGIVFGLSETYIGERRADHGTFYCPNGDKQYYPAESDAERFKRRMVWAEQQRDSERRQHEVTKHRLRATKGAHTRTKNRIRQGVCPHCNRYFKNLHEHMLTKHEGVTNE